jgi:hypothetical protein
MRANMVLCSPGQSRPVWSTSAIAIAFEALRQALALPVGCAHLPASRWRCASNDPLHDHTYQPSRRPVAIQSPMSLMPVPLRVRRRHLSGKVSFPPLPPTGPRKPQQRSHP